MSTDKASRDTDVSGAEAVATNKLTYSDKKIKDVKKQAFIAHFKLDLLKQEHTLMKKF